MTSHPSLPLPELSVHDLLCTSDLTTEDIEHVFTTAVTLKAGRDEHNQVLRQKRLAMIFEKKGMSGVEPSTLSSTKRKPSTA